MFEKVLHFKVKGGINYLGRLIHIDIRRDIEPVKSGNVI